MAHRFSNAPAQGLTPLDIHRLRVLAKPDGVAKIDAMKIIALVQKNKNIKLAGNDKLRIEREFADPKDRAQDVRDVLRALGPPVAAAPR